MVLEPWMFRTAAAMFVLSLSTGLLLLLNIHLERG